MPLRGEDPYEFQIGGHEVCIWAGREYVELKVDDATAHILRWQVFRRFVRRATLAFIVLALMSTLAAYLSYHAQAKSERETRTEARRAVFAACLDRMDLRVTNAIAIDELRRSALTPPKTQAEREGLQQFIERTQGPINRLLSEAASRPVKLKDGVGERDIVLIRVDGRRACESEASRFDPRKPPG